MEQNRKAERITLASIIGIGLLGLATRTVIAFNTLDPHTPVINRLVEAASNNLLGLAQQLVPFAHTPELQIIEMIAGLTALAGITVGGGKLIDKASTRKNPKRTADHCSARNIALPALSGTKGSGWQIFMRTVSD